MPSPSPTQSAPRLAVFVSAFLLAFALLLTLAPVALAEALRVSVPLDPTLPQAQARLQALERAFAEAVAQDALRILPAPLPERRVEALRAFLAPKSRDLVLSYQESAPKAHGQGAVEVPTPPAAPVALDYDIEVNRPALRAQLQRLGLLSGGARGYALRLGPGVAESELKALEELNLVMGLERAPAQLSAPLDITLEKLPQGYYKAVLRQAARPGAAPAAAIAPIAADGSDIPAVWQNLWGMLFAGRDFRPGGAARSVDLSGWTGLDGVLDFDRLLSGWDECVQDVQIATVDLRSGGISARWTVRVVNQSRLAERLREVLPVRRLTLARAEALLGEAAKP